MKQIASIFALVVGLSLVTGCANKDSVKKVLKENPDILAEVIKENPVEIMDALSAASMEYRRKKFEEEQKVASQERDEEFKNPKKPEIQDDRVIFGPKEAAITIVEYSDFQCPFCARGWQRMQQLKEKYGDKIRIIYKHLPLRDKHPLAEPAALYFEAIGKQDPDKAEQFHDLIFEDQQALNQKGEDHLDTLAKKVGANLSRVKKDIKSDELRALVQKDEAEAAKFGIRGTPGFLINGVSVRGAAPLDEFTKIVDRHLKN